MKAEEITERAFDVIVVGGGPAGAAASIRLASGGARVLVVERERFPRGKLCGEFISPECFRHFERLGVAPAIEEAGGARLGETRFYAGSGRSAAVPSEWFGGGAWALGLSRAEMDARLLARAREAGATVLEEANAAGVVLDGGGRVRGVRVQVGGAERVFESLLTLDATGRSRVLARKLEGASRGGEETGRAGARGEAGGRAKDVGRRRGRLVAFKAHLEGARAAAGACEIYFYRGGYGGLSGVERGLNNLCFIAPAADVRARGGDAGRVMREVLMRNRRAAETLGGARAVTPWLAVALEGFGRFRVAPAPGLLVVGDAASFIDPFTGSGMLMALESGELAAEAAARALPQLRGASSAGGARESEESRGALRALASEYRARYGGRFDARLRACSHLRRAAFAPRALTELGVAVLGASAWARRAVARSTRGRGAERAGAGPARRGAGG